MVIVVSITILFLCLTFPSASDRWFVRTNI